MAKQLLAKIALVVLAFPHTRMLSLTSSWFENQRLIFQMGLGTKLKNAMNQLETCMYFLMFAPDLLM